MFAMLSAPSTSSQMRPFAIHMGIIAAFIISCLSAGALARSSTSNLAGFVNRAVSFSDEVSFDNYSLILKGQRVFLHSGEVHTYRIPVPSLWPDILQKIKAAGLNAVSVYTHMGQLNPSRGVIDLDGYRSLKAIYEAASDAGLWLVMRPGPYINAETSAGGISHWITSEVAGKLRTNASDWTDAWQDYIQAFIEETVPYQITNGGPVIAVQIDNEYTQSVGDTFFQTLEDVYRASDIVVPLTYNDPNQGGNFINGTGAVDLYGLDSYPQSFDCSQPTVWKNVTTTYHDYHEHVNPSQPFYIPEFQGGAFDPYGGGNFGSPGYANCAILTGADFMSVFYKQLWASNVKLVSYYMIYGGTSWGAIPFPGVYTSYDYGAAIAEDRSIGSKYDELKRQGYFIRSSPEFYKTDWVADSLSGLSVTDSHAIFTTYLKNPDTQSGFYVVRHNDSTTMAVTDFHVNVSTSLGDFEVPATASMSLNGRQSKVVVTDYSFGSNSTLLYSTASIYFAGVIDGRDVILLYGDANESHEFLMEFTGESLGNNTQSVSLSVTEMDGLSLVNVASDSSPGVITIQDTDKQLVLFADTETASSFWSPVIPGNADDPFRTYWAFGTNETVLISGPYLVRSADIRGSTLVLTGDLNSTTTISVISPSHVDAVTWNGQALNVSAAPAVTKQGGLVATLPFAGTTFDAPALTGWKFMDSLPEIGPSYDDSDWTVANHTTTNIPYPPYYGDGTILYGCDYGFCENIVLWRGHFNGTEQKSVNLSINGGEAFAATVWLNDVFLNTSYGNSSNNKNILEETDDLFIFPEGSIVPGENVITVVQDNMGLNETNDGNANTSKSPRGIRGFQLDVGNFSAWKVHGKVGGYTGYLDKTRGVMNEGGLFGERSGWHLPGFDTSDWESRDLADGLPDSAAGVGFFVTTFELAIPSGFDVHMSFTFTEPLGQPYRIYMFVNGWMMGKRVGNLGPQAKFPVHEGILDYNGTNTVAVALWAMEQNQTIAPVGKLAIEISGNIWHGQT